MSASFVALTTTIVAIHRREMNHVTEIDAARVIVPLVARLIIAAAVVEVAVAPFS